MLRNMYICATSQIHLKFTACQVLSLIVCLLLFSHFQLMHQQQTRNTIKKSLKAVFSQSFRVWNLFWKIPQNSILGIIVYNEMLFKKGKETNFQDKLMCCKGREHVTDIALYFTMPHRSIWGSCFANVLTDGLGMLNPWLTVYDVCGTKQRAACG